MKRVKIKNFSFILFLGTLFFLSFLLVIFAGSSVDEKLGTPLSFNVRELLEEEPEIHPSIKVFKLDDLSFQKMGSELDSAETWVDILETLLKSEPRIIFIDKLFSAPYIISEKVKERLLALQHKYANIVVGAFGSNDKLSGWSPLNSEKWSNMVWKGEGTKEKFLYGPHESVRFLFDHVGHIEFPGDGYIEPFIVVQEKRLIPQLGFKLAHSFDYNLDENLLRVDGFKIPLMRNGKIYPNLFSSKKMEGKEFSFYPLYRYAKRKKEIPVVHKGDVVILIPGAYTGGTDFVSTPFGERTGGDIHVAVINSLLQFDWLNYWDYRGILVTLCVISGFILGFLLGGGLGVSIFILGTAGIISFGLLSFAYFNLLIPWASCFLGFAGSYFPGVYLRAMRLEKRELAVSHALEGLVSPKLLKNMKIMACGNMDFKASSQEVSVMFVDISDFSMVTEDLEPQYVFQLLKEELNIISSFILQYDGIIDKTLGDGLLAFFGYSYDGQKPSKNHALTALECAHAIQKDSARRIIKRGSKCPDPFFPLRVGINSGTVFVGNLGSGQRIDLTIVGGIVNYAKRFEDACESFRVLIGNSTYQTLPEDLRKGLILRYLIPKHHMDLWEAWESEPLEMSARKNLRMSLNDRVGQRRRVQRFTVPREKKVFVELGRHYEFNALLVDFSEIGLLIESDVFLSRKVELPLILKSEDGILEIILKNQSITPLLVSVRWGQVMEGRYLLGLRIMNLSDYQQIIFVDQLKNYLGLSEKIKDENTLGHQL